MVIGMPTYGRSFTLADKNNFSVNVATKGGGNAGTYTKESGFLAYYEVCIYLLINCIASWIIIVKALSLFSQICELLRSGAKYVWDDEMKVPYLIDGDQWVGFDDEKSIRNKMKWIIEEGFAGAMVWTVDMDGKLKTKDLRHANIC